MDQFELAVSPRLDAGKGASRRLRREGMVPAIVYGGDGDPQSIQIERFELENHMKHEAFYSHVLTLNFNDKSERVVLKDVQRHPIRPLINHVDFLRVNENEAITMHVPLHFINEEKCVGIKAGGILNKLANELEVSCLPRDLPEYIEVDVAAIDVGQAIHLGEIEVPEGVTIAALAHGGDAQQSVVSVAAPTVEQETDGEADVAAEAEDAPAAGDDA